MKEINLKEEKRQTEQQTENLFTEQQTEKQTENPFAGKPVRDIDSKVIFKDPTLCCQFLKDNIDIPLLKNIRPDDIEDVTDHYHPYIGAEFESDTVKKIHIHSKAHLYVISLIEHKSQVDYNVTIQLLKYITCIWDDYAKEMERKNKGISKSKGFRYPPVLPIVYYEGKGSWTADLHLKDRILLQEIFAEYIPDFRYILVGIHTYSDAELMSREDEMSLLMMINKVQSPEDLREFLEIQHDKIERILEKTPERILTIIADTIWALCMKMNVPTKEAKECVKKVKERQMGYLFENMEKMDIQAERRNTAEAKEKLKKYQQEAEKKIEDIQRKHIEDIITMSKEYGADKLSITEKLIEKCGLNRYEAEEAIAQYWEE